MKVSREHSQCCCGPPTCILSESLCVNRSLSLFQTGMTPPVAIPYPPYPPPLSTPPHNESTHLHKRSISISTLKSCTRSQVIPGRVKSFLSTGFWSKIGTRDENTCGFGTNDQQQLVLMCFQYQKYISTAKFGSTMFQRCAVHIETHHCVRLFIPNYLSDANILCLRACMFHMCDAKSRYLRACMMHRCDAGTVNPRMNDPLRRAPQRYLRSFG